MLNCEIGLNRLDQLRLQITIKFATALDRPMWKQKSNCDIETKATDIISAVQNSATVFLDSILRRHIKVVLNQLISVIGNHPTHALCTHTKQKQKRERKGSQAPFL